MASFKATLFWLVIFISLGNFLVFSSFEFQVGGTQGWVVPPTNDSKVYNDWASENRFQVGNVIRKYIYIYTYSVMVGEPPFKLGLRFLIVLWRF